MGWRMPSAIVWLMLLSSAGIRAQNTTFVDLNMTTSPDLNQTQTDTTTSLNTPTPQLNTTIPITQPTSSQRITLPSSAATTAASSAGLPATLIDANTDLAVCTCDLTQGLCDINCCCDGECSAEDRLVFSTCEDQLEAETDNSNLCSYSVKVFRDNTVSTQTVNNPFIFCVWRERNVARNFYTPVDLAKTNESFAQYSSENSRYSFQYQYTEPEATASPSRTHYKSGELLVALRGANAGLFYVPAGVATTSSCVDKNPAKFLRELSSSCVRHLPRLLSDVCETEPSLSAYELEQQLLALSIKIRPDRNVTAQDIVAVAVTGDRPTPVYDATSNTCVGIIKEVAYAITHEAGSLVTIGASITTHDLNGALTAVQQKYTLSYIEVNQNSTGFRRSGNPGYLVGEPVLAGREGEGGNFVDLNGDRSKYLTMVSASAEGDCVTDSLRRESILFGTDYRSGCVWRLKRASTCNDISTLVIEALLGPTRSIATDGSLRIASFGNSDPLKIDDWVKVVVNNQLNAQGCSGAALHLEILYANIGALSNPQSMIIGAELVLKSTSLEFQCVGPFCLPQNSEATQSFEMVTSVAFVDVTQPSVAAIAEKPVASSKLPYNFFHPYYVMSSSQVITGSYVTLAASFLGLYVCR